ncbi:MAG TPA: NADH-ubiquinone oxidoreductase-F iron-sulfur binding region domain-containing protein [Candidatus Latescibacteria bacterium]|jgi:formate dehydrogenase iron-sulfur subunit|nr:NADH-ubiquinone oxidoreductase-F iron-sulfur binding region domain-containing protein [Candidatus Latescibacterota bacterium]HJN30329.1 NADH-ubiquinone oxidoreductase-F iron-sulfur binding region domain-containing protein [Candidatus Latescibacterota bacterium]
MSRNLIALQNKFLGEGQTVYDSLARLHADKGHIAPQDILDLAQEHNLPPAHVRATAEFYDELAQSSAAQRSLKICNGEACRAAGCDAVIERCESELGVTTGEVSSSGTRLEHVACLGYCGQGPNAMIDDLPVSLASTGAVDAALKSVLSESEHGLTEPKNPIYRPESDAPCVVLRNAGQDVIGLTDARAAGIYGALEKAVTSLQPQDVIDQIKASQLRGRGGAGFPTGIKLQTVADSEAPDGSGRRFVVVNFDEGDAGSYIDKELVENDPHSQIEGILLAAYATGAREAIIYARCEYPRARRVLEAAVDEARAAGLVGASLFGSDFACDITVVRGQGAYICGEETSLLRSLEGVPALVSVRPPFPAQEGLWRCPTAVNNVETIHTLPWIIEHGADAYASLGHEKSRGTKVISLNHRVAHPGVYEVELGVTLRHVIFDLAGGMADGQSCKAVQVGGPLGGLLPESLLDTRLDFEAMAAQGAILGHGGIVVYSQEDDLVKIGRGLIHFCAVESCGKCFPCRIGAVRGTELFDQMMESGVTDERVELLGELCETMKYGSLCAMGGMTPAPIESLIQHFPDELGRYRKSVASERTP